MNETLFQYCPKLAVFSASRSELLLCRRKGELDYDGVFSLIGGKMEHKDASIIDGIRREKNEEAGGNFVVRLLPHHSVDVLFTKKDGNRMILPHFYAEHVSGEIVLSDEYSEFRWVDLNELSHFTPMIENVRWIGPLLQRAGANANLAEFVEI
jgi:ADP-ribose pyrophosphatase YjhB (NUDIX family)